MVIEARLAAHGSVNSAQQGGGHIDEPHAALKRCRGKSAQVGHHAAAQVDDERMAGYPHALHLVPHARDGLERLVVVTVGDGDKVG